MKPLSLILLLLALCLKGFSQNPIVRDVGMSDPHIRVFGDTVFLYCGHDDRPDDTTWVMKEWRVYSTTDLIHWKKEGTISPVDNYMHNNSTDCWAGDAETRNGKYYFYFSDRKRGVGVMISDKPAGPFHDPLGNPLVSPMHDPTILIDDDEEQSPYLIYGDKEGGGFHIARLNEDMISLDEEPRPLRIDGPEWLDAPVWMDKNYLFKYKKTYYLSWGRDYATSDNIYGPYVCQGAVGNGFSLSEYAHGSFFWWKGQFYHTWCYYLRPGYKYRETIITYCHFDDEGKIVTDTDFLDKHFENGVGQYSASWPEIQAEWYYESAGGMKKEGNRENGFYMTGIRDGSWLRFSNVSFNGKDKYITANIQIVGGKGRLELRTDHLKGPVISTLELTDSNKPDCLDCYQELSSKIKKIEGQKDIYLVYSGNPGSEIKMDWIRFSK